VPAKPLNANDVKPMPWIGVDTPRLREQVANYYNCLERLDVAVGMMLDELQKTGQSENTLVFYIGDHGAQFPRGKGTVYESGLRVPMIVRWPGQAQAGQVRQELVSTLDLLPTALVAAGVKPMDELPGQALQPLLAGGSAPDRRRYIFGFTTGSFPGNCFVQHSVRDERFKLISSPRPDTDNLVSRSYLDESHPYFVVSGATVADQAAIAPRVRNAFDRWSRPPRYELYDLNSDPYEWHNLAGDPELSAVRARLLKALTDMQQQTRDQFLDTTNTEAFVVEQLANRDLGYRSRQDFRWSYLDTFPAWRGDKDRN
jgi:N-sulfoglucosamine sulfohydrolase